jgi:hypothetical protein
MVSVSVSVSNAGASGSTLNDGPSRQYESRRSAYPSNVTGNRIVNAETGVATDYRVGSLDEYLFFKVADSTHRNSNGDSDIYFYDSPENYLRHRFSRVRYNAKSKRGSNTRDNYEKARKDEMLSNPGNAMVHWDLVDSRGAPTDNASRAYMQPRINPAYSAKWTARRAQRVGQVSTVAALEAA